MAKKTGHDLEIDTICEHESGVCVPKTVKRDVRKVRVFHKLLEFFFRHSCGLRNRHEHWSRPFLDVGMVHFFLPSAFGIPLGVLCGTAAVPSAARSSQFAGYSTWFLEYPTSVLTLRSPGCAE